MGSYLTIVNNTQDTWHCKVGPDKAALKVSTIIFGVIASGLASLAIASQVLQFITIASIPLAVLAGTAIAALFPWLIVGTGLALVSGLEIAPLVTGIAVVEMLPLATLISSAGAATAAIGVGATGAVASTAGVGAAVAGTAAITPFGIAITEALKEKLRIKGFDTIRAGQSHRYGKMTLALWQQSECKRTYTSGPYVVVDTVIMRPIFSGSTVNSNRNHTIHYWIEKHGITSRYGIEGRSGNKTRKLEEVGEQIQQYRFYRNGTTYNAQNGVFY